MTIKHRRCADLDLQTLAERVTSGAVLYAVVSSDNDNAGLTAAHDICRAGCNHRSILFLSDDGVALNIGEVERRTNPFSEISRVPAA
jgi:hypothetical protein